MIPFVSQMPSLATCGAKNFCQKIGRTSMDKETGANITRKNGAPSMVRPLSRRNVMTLLATSASIVPLSKLGAQPDRQNHRALKQRTSLDALIAQFKQNEKEAIRAQEAAETAKRAVKELTPPIVGIAHGETGVYGVIQGDKTTMFPSTVIFLKTHEEIDRAKGIDRDSAHRELSRQEADAVATIPKHLMRAKLRTEKAADRLWQKDSSLRHQIAHYKPTTFAEVRTLAKFALDRQTFCDDELRSVLAGVAKFTAHAA
jgi:hypothetical protein